MEFGQKSPAERFNTQVAACNEASGRIAMLINPLGPLSNGPGWREAIGELTPTQSFQFKVTDRHDLLIGEARETVVSRLDTAAERLALLRHHMQDTRLPISDGVRLVWQVADRPVSELIASGLADDFFAWLQRMNVVKREDRTTLEDYVVSVYLAEQGAFDRRLALSDKEVAAAREAKAGDDIYDTYQIAGAIEDIASNRALAALVEEEILPRDHPYNKIMIEVFGPVPKMTLWHRPDECGPESPKVSVIRWEAFLAMEGDLFLEDGTQTVDWGDVGKPVYNRATAAASPDQQRLALAVLDHLGAGYQELEVMDGAELLQLVREQMSGD